MTLSNTETRVVQLGNGATTAFAFTFLIPQSGDEVITFTDASGNGTILSNTVYTVTGFGNPTGGFVTYPLVGSPIASGTSLTIQRIVPVVQDTSIANQAFYPAVIESALDYLTMIDQQIEDQIGRQITAPPSDPVGVNYTLPAIAQRLGQVLSFDASGNVIVGQLSSVAVSAAMTPVVQASTISVAQELLGITVFTSIAPALGNGTTPASTAINAAITALGSAGGNVLFPPGNFLIDALITIPSNVTLVGSGRGATVLTGAAALTGDMLQTTGFAGLTGTNSTGGPYKFGLRHLSVNGNKAARLGSGNGISIYGIDFTIEDIEIYNCLTNCWYSEWSTSGTVPTPNGDSMEAHVRGLKVYGAGQDGIVWNGPHDSNLQDVLTFINGRYGLNTNNSAVFAGGGTTFTNFHSYGNLNHGVYCNSNILCTEFASESNSGDGIHIVDTTFSNFVGVNISIYNNAGNGFNLTQGFATIAGIQAFANTAKGIVVSGVLTASDVKVFSNGATGIHIITGNGSVLSTVETFSNTGSGLEADVGCSISAIWSHGNTVDGIIVNGSDCAISAIKAEGNTGNGINLASSVSSIVLSGKASGNATQLANINNISAGIIDITTFNTAGGQTSYTGSIGNVYARVATAGSGALSPVTHSQT